MTKIVLLDGGMGQELMKRSKNDPTPLWSAHVLMEEPQIVIDVHQDYLDAGCRVMTLNNYSATPERLARDATADLFKPLQAKSIEVAKKAAGDSGVTIAGCLPPLYGSYNSEAAPEFEECLAKYREIVAEQKNDVSVFKCETMSTIREAKASVFAAAETGVPVWCSFSVMDEDGTRLRSGEPLEEAVDIVKDAGASAVLVNCSWPEAVTQAIPILAATGLPFGGYANAFTKADDLKLGGTVDALSARTDLGPAAYAKHAMGWVASGATIVGGCCEVGPAHMKYLAGELVAAGHELTGQL